MLAISIPDFTGRLLTPNTDDYEQARQPWLRNHNSKPVFIAEVQTIDDIQKVMRYAYDKDLPVAVQATGHGAFKPTDGAVLIKTQAMRRLRVDPETQTATFDPGIKVGDLVVAASEYGLSPITGDSPYAGAVGFTLGGGHGWLSRQFGFAADSIVEAQLVTTSGEVVIANESKHTDLFWALKGGSGNFGVVTSLTVRLHPVQKGLGGTVYFAAEHARELLDHYSVWAQTLPAQYTAFLQALSLPSIPQLPATISGQRVIALQLFFNDSSSTTNSILQKFLDTLSCSPLENFVSEQAYADFLMSAPKLPPTAAVDTVSLQAEITAEQIPQLATFMQAGESFTPIIQIRPWGGVLTKPQPHSLLQYPEVGYSIYAIASFQDDKSRDSTQKNFAPLARHITHYASKQRFINFTPDETAMEHAYSEESTQRLKVIKKKYDPKNLLSLGHTIA